jgi:hypothetical protein
MRVKIPKAPSTVDRVSDFLSGASCWYCAAAQHDPQSLRSRGQQHTPLLRIAAQEDLEMVEQIHAERLLHAIEPYSAWMFV